MSIDRTQFAAQDWIEPRPNMGGAHRPASAPFWSRQYHDVAFVNALAIVAHDHASAFTNRLDTAMRCVRELDATAVMVNDHTAFRVDWMPFAGRRLSGYATGGIGYTMHDMTQDKLAVIKM